MERMEVTAERVKLDLERFAKSCPEYYAERVRKDYILDGSRQKELSGLDGQKFLDFLMDRGTSDHLDIFPENANSVMQAFEGEIFERLNSLVKVKYEDLSQLRKELEHRAEIISLDKWGEDMYTQVPREYGATMGSGELEFKVSRARPVEGPRFFATDVKGYYGFLRFYTEEMARLVPKEANAYLMGTAWIVTVRNKRASSPLIAGHYFDVGQPDDLYQVAPVRFFDVEVDRSRKYETVSEVKERDPRGNAILILTRVAPRK
jgi:hypothetical protein